MAPHDRVLLSGRDPSRVAAAARAVAADPATVATVEGHVLDVRDGAATAARETATIIGTTVGEVNAGVALGGAVAGQFATIAGQVARTTALVAEIAGLSADQADGVRRIETAAAEATEK